MFSIFPGWLKTRLRQRWHEGDFKMLASQNRIPDLDASLFRLRQSGVQLQSIFDIGSYHGDFIESCLQLWPNSEIIGFEPLPDKQELLRKRFSGRNVQIENCIVGSSDEQQVLFFTDESASSTLPSAEVNTKKGTILQRMTKLDTYVLENNLKVPNLLQIDTLSSEYDILKGFEGHLSQLQFIILQVNFLEVFDGVKPAHEVIDFLYHFGFVIYDVCDVHRRPLDLALWQMDLLFVKEDSYLRCNKKWG